MDTLARLAKEAGLTFDLQGEAKMNMKSRPFGGHPVGELYPIDPRAPSTSPFASFPKPGGSGPSGRQTDGERLGYDAINLPDHYACFKIEPISFCQENKLDALQTAVVKYVCRYRLKNGIEDLNKAQRCLDMLIKYEQGDCDWWRHPSSTKPIPPFQAEKESLSWKTTQRHPAPVPPS